MSKDYDRLVDLLSDIDTSKLQPWFVGRIPEHYKRINIDKSTQLRLAREGAKMIAGYYGEKLYFTQAVIAGAMFSGEYDFCYIISPSQYGKSWLMGRVGLLKAYMGRRTYVGGAAANVADIIMSEVVNAVQTVDDSVKTELVAGDRTSLDRLSTSLSKTRIGFKNGGFIQALTLGDTYNGIVANKAVGRGGDYIIDEAADVGDDTLAELGRGEFASVDHTKYPLVMISNPHKPGVFYDNMIDPDPDDRTLIVWMDARTAVEEERFGVEQVLTSNFAKRTSTLRRYLLCELDTEGEGMFGTVKTSGEPENDSYRQYFLGVDAAYKGKDNIEVCLTSVGENGQIYVHEIYKMYKDEWIDGVTSRDIIRDISKIASYYHVSMICVDVGYGVWLIDGLTQSGYNVRGINFGAGPTKERVRGKHYSAVNATNMRAELHLDLQSLIDDDKIRFSEESNDKIKSILPFVSAERRSSGKIKIRDKGEIKVLIGRSPDELDAVLLSIHAMILMCGESFEFLT